MSEASDYDRRHTTGEPRASRLMPKIGTTKLDLTAHRIQELVNTRRIK